MVGGKLKDGDLGEDEVNKYLQPFSGTPSKNATSFRPSGDCVRRPAKVYMEEEKKGCSLRAKRSF